MKVETLTIKEYMDISLITETFKDDPIKYQKKLIEYFNGSLDVPLAESDETVLTLEKVLNEELGLVIRFEIEGKEFGLIPNLENMTTGEYIDLDEYMKEGKRLDKIMAILYRPITENIGDLYTIEKYEGSDKYSETMKKIDFKIAKSVMVFFSNLEKSLLNASLIFIGKQKNGKKMVEEIENTHQKHSSTMSLDGM